MLKKKVWASIVVLGTMLLHDVLKYAYAYLIFGREKYNALPDDTKIWLIQITALLLCVLATALLTSFDRRKTIEYLGLDKSPLTGIGVALICTLPMFIGFYFTAPVRHDLSLYNVFETAIWPGFNEELVFRAFISGLLMRKGGWHFIPAALISALLFAKGHLYQAQSPAEAVTIFLFVSGAGIGFAVFYWLWKWNIWVTIFLHMLMNLSFNIFDVGGTSLLTPTANIFRASTIFIAIILTVIFVYRNKRSEHKTVS